jgi:23S rRNA pseudouridine2605 synthase
METKLYLPKFIALCGKLSRRAAQQAVLLGEVTVNGTIITDPSHRVDLKDHVKLHGKLLREPQEKIYLLFNKPASVITSTKDASGRPTVVDLLPKGFKQKVFPVGRLDLMTKGLLLMTNDGDLAYRLAHPKFEVPKTYLATLDRNATDLDLEKISKGFYLYDGFVRADKINFATKGSNRKVVINIHSGKNRIIRRIFTHLGYNVETLERTGYAGLSVRGLPEGCYKLLTKAEVQKLVQQASLA